MNLMQAIRCRRTAKRLSRYIDMDPASQLSDEEIHQIRAHLAECEKCTLAEKDLIKIKNSLRWIGSSQSLDESSLTRLKVTLDDLSHP